MTCGASVATSTKVAGTVASSPAANDRQSSGAVRHRSGMRTRRATGEAATTALVVSTSLSAASNHAAGVSKRTVEMLAHSLVASV